MRKLMTMLLGISLLGAPVMFAASKKGGGKKVEKSPDAAKTAEKLQKDGKTKSAADQKAQK